VYRFSSFATGIRFADYVFGEPVPFGIYSAPPHMTGLYAVLVPDPTWRPRQFQPIFFGVFDGRRECQLSTAEHTACLRIAAGKGLYIAMYNLPPVYGLTESDRMRRELIQVYSPICNRESMDAHSSELAFKLDALEKKNQEHEMLMKVLLAAVGHLVQPPQEIKRRTVGFQPESRATR
jgi:hypothetical protein